MIVYELGGKWRLNKVGENRSISASVPGDVYKDLLTEGEIADPFYRDNESRLQWIGQSDWLYSRTFELPDEVLKQKHIKLVCDGLDTFAEITINGRKVAKTDNMFRQWVWDIKEFASRSNTIEILFISTIPYIEQREESLHLPVLGGEEAMSYRAAHCGWVRKQQCNYGWDWGIKAVTCGIWRDIRIEAFTAAAIGDVSITQNHLENGEVDVLVGVEAQRASDSELYARVSAIFKGDVVACQTQEVVCDNFQAVLKIKSPCLWWLNNMGEQNLYDIKVEILDAGENVIVRQVKRIGLRTLRLDRHKDKWGESFQFVINGVPFFAKGANWIPADGVLARMTPQRYRQLISDAADSNMNMLRVWGGGIYEDEAFYDACDELGICVWQDFMFACSAYPAFDDDFIENVRQEAIYNVKRLHHRACLALWCGNNELEQGLVGDKWSDSTMSWEDYGRLFDKLLPSIVQQFCPTCDYWCASPHTPYGDRYDFNNPNCGDAHLWGVWFAGEPFEWYRSCEHRFNSEFGFQSFPSPQTVESYTAKKDRNITSWIMEYHQRSPVGNKTIIRYMLDWFKMPLGFENTLWLSQIQQGMVIKYACEHWRRSMPRGMGTLYWQLNDTWQVASWSSIDYFGRWKALQYMARNFFAPLLISGLESVENSTFEVHITNDLLADTQSVARWKVTDAKGRQLLCGQKQIVVPKCSNVLTQTVEIKDIIAQKSVRDVIVWLELEVGGEIVSENMVLFARPKHLELAEDVHITADVEKISACVFNVIISADKPALWVRLELDRIDAKYSDNFFNICSGVLKRVEVELAEDISAADFKKKLSVSSLINTY